MISISTLSLSDNSTLFKGGLALKLVEEQGLLIHKSRVIASVYQFIFWCSIPFQSISAAHMDGYNVGQQTGDTVS